MLGLPRCNWRSLEIVGNLHRVIKFTVYVCIVPRPNCFSINTTKLTVTMGRRAKNQYNLEQPPPQTSSFCQKTLKAARPSQDCEGKAVEIKFVVFFLGGQHVQGWFSGILVQIWKIANCSKLCVGKLLA